MNIKRGLKRLWIVGSILWAIGVIGMTISTFPEQPKQTKQEEIKGWWDKYFDEFLENNKDDKDIKDLIHKREAKLKNEKEKEEVLKKVRKRVYEEKKNKALLLLLKGFGVLVFMWGLLYIGFWVGSGFISGDKRKDVADE